MLAPINALADASPGFVWRLQGETGDATGIRAFGDDRILVNLSVWETIEALGAFVFTSRHTEVLRRRRDWFEQMAEAHLALWWIPAGATPDRRGGRAAPRDPARTRPVLGRLHLAGAVPRARLERPGALAGSLAVPHHRAAGVRCLAPSPRAGRRSALRDEALGPGPRPSGGAARSVGSPGAGCADGSVRAAVPVLALAAGRPDRVPGPTGRIPPARLLRQHRASNAFSTFETMLAGETNCRVPSDTAGYWAPTGFLNGVRLKPGVMRIYYLGPATGTPGTIPAGLQMVGGNKEAQSPAENPHVSWSCGQTTSVSTPHRDTPYDCRPWAQYAFVDGIVASIDFPSCWNGTGLRPEDVTYPEGGACPPGFGNIIPKLSERVHYGVMNPFGLDGTLAFQLSSGPPYSMHADFWNTWQQERLDQLVADCLVAKVHCGSVDATSTIRWVRQFGTQRYDLANAAAPDGEGGSYAAGFTNFSLDGTAVPPSLRRVPHPVRRGRRQAVDPAVRHERDRSGSRDLGLRDRRVRRGFDRRAVPQAEGERRDRRVRRPVRRRRQAGVAEAVRYAPRRRGRRDLGQRGSRSSLPGRRAGRSIGSGSTGRPTRS